MIFVVFKRYMNIRCDGLSDLETTSGYQHCKCCIRSSSLEIRAIEDGYDGCDGYLLFMPTSDRHAGIFLFIFERKEKYPVSL